MANDTQVSRIPRPGGQVLGRVFRTPLGRRPSAMLPVRDADGVAAYYLHVGEGHRAFHFESLDRNTGPVDVTGSLEYCGTAQVPVVVPKAMHRVTVRGKWRP